MNTKNAPDTLWFPKLGNSPNASCRLFCFPYAGGSSFIFNSWSKTIAENVELVAIQLPGRANRMTEKPFTNVESLVEVLTEKILPFTSMPFAFFGHSMGAIISYELAVNLMKEVSIEPIHLFVSGRSAPHLAAREKITYNLPDKEFIKEIAKLNGTPKEILQNAELLELLFPLLRADFELVETYGFKNHAPLNCPISAFGGSDDDEVPVEDVKAWKQHTVSDFKLNILEGDHFFINHFGDFFTKTISSELRNY